MSALADIHSTFDLGDEGWTQMDLTGDIRYVEPTPLAEPGDCVLEPAPNSGFLWFRDPDAGEWVFEAPAKFLGDQSAMFGGTIRWSQYHNSCEVWDTSDSGFRVVLVNTNRAVAIVQSMVPPPQDQWISLSVKLDDQSGWAWCDETTGQEDLPPATAAQIQEVLQSVTGFRIVGEFITGEDIGCLDNVIFSRISEPEPPRLSVTCATTNVVISWPSVESGWRLQMTTNLSAAPVNWTEIPPPYTTNATNCLLIESVPAGHKFYRLRKP